MELVKWNYQGEETKREAILVSNLTQPDSEDTVLVLKNPNTQSEFITINGTFQGPLTHIYQSLLIIKAKMDYINQVLTHNN